MFQSFHGDKGTYTHTEVLDFVTKIIDELGLGHLWDNFAAELDQL